MAVFWRLLFAHFLGDFTFQSNFINRWKRQSIVGMLVHCSIHPVLSILLAYPYLNKIWLDFHFMRLNGWACILIVYATHFIEDEWRVFTIFKYHLPDNTLYFLWDQVVHYAVLFAVIPTALRDMPVSLVPEKWPVLGCLFVIVTHAATVLVYFIEKDIRNKPFPAFGEKYFPMLERFVLAVCLMVPGHFWPLMVIAWISVMHFVRDSKAMGLSWMSFYLGGGMAFVCGVIARVVYYS